MALLISIPASAATISYDGWSKSGSDTVIPEFTVSDDYSGKFKVSINIDKANSPNDMAKISGVYFDLGNSVTSGADISGQSAAYTNFATNNSKIGGVTNLNLGNFDTILGYKGQTDATLSFFVSDQGGALSLNDWGRVGVRFQSVGANGEGSDKEVSANKTYVTNQYVTPIPAAAWLFGSGLMGLIGVTKRRKKA
ncbi:MAG: VPLPA-CTERM sorting domain-containing protein [Methylococcales bacterium]|nr:VPLPA-CTERM sorting domain-containing protein [Methylococcales bacterium]